MAVWMFVEYGATSQHQRHQPPGQRHPLREKAATPAADFAVQERAETKKRVTFHMPTDLIERTRNAVFWTSGATLAGLVEEAVAAHLDKLEKERGEPFPQRTGKIKTGRPMK